MKGLVQAKRSYSYRACETRHRPTARAEAPRSFDRLRTRDGFRCSLPGREWPVSSVPAMTNGLSGNHDRLGLHQGELLGIHGQVGGDQAFSSSPGRHSACVWAALFGATSRSSRKLRAPRTRAACFSQLSRSVRYRGRAARIAHTSAAPSRSTYFTTPVTALAWGDELVNGLPQVGKPPPLDRLAHPYLLQRQLFPQQFGIERCHFEVAIGIHQQVRGRCLANLEHLFAVVEMFQAAIASDAVGADVLVQAGDQFDQGELGVVDCLRRSLIESNGNRAWRSEARPPGGPREALRVRGRLPDCRGFRTRIPGTRGLRHHSFREPGKR